MGGDHKCPVCQATFTRPQHVARHMRSHTGDRPYKCQHCGDQFARSDLLSRHVNKCHASEKLLPNAGNARRKGAVSATRATTSKQSCDQCVLATLPCDGSNPCLKCISWKHPCTYVKFHRQTAPIGPGHNTRPTASIGSPSSSSLPNSAFSNGEPPSRPPLYQHSDDEFVLGPAPGSVPTMTDSLYSSNSYAFPPLYPPNTDLNAMPNNLDYGAKYRPQQAEFFGPGRSGMGTGLTPLYDPRHETSTPNPSWLGGWESQGAHDAFHHSQHQGPRQAELVPSHGPSSAIHDKPELAYHPAAQSQQTHLDNPPIPMAMPYLAAFALPRSPPHQRQGRNSTSSYDSSNPNSRRGSVDFSGSDSTSVSGHASGSANCSNVHLPLGNSGVDSLGYDDTGYNLANNIPHRTPSASSNSSHDRYDPHDRQEFSSAFGLMSLDDPAVMAGLAVDGQPFFDDPSQVHNRQESTDPEGNHDGLLTTDVGPDIDTPMPLRRDAALLSIGQRPATSTGVPGANSGGATANGFGSTFGMPTPSKDTDTRELREFWKQYMRTPLSGPQDAIGNIVGPLISSKNPSPVAHRRQRVASLPSAKTPMVERDDMFVHPQGLGYHPVQQPDQRGRENAAALGPTSSLRTTLHAKEDLSSYEAAVMARKAPTLNLQLKRPVKGKNLCSANQHPRPCGEANTKVNPHSNVNTQTGHGSRPPSSSGIPRSSSTLANAFGNHGNSIVSLASSRSLSGKGSVSPSLPPSRDTSDAYSTYASSDVELRPSFKRLASQTLGPENSKRTFFGYGGDKVGEMDKTAGWSTTVPEVPLSEFGVNSSSGTAHLVASIAERRRRRMSAPSSTIDTAKVSQSQHSQPADGKIVRPLGYAPATQGV